MPPEGKDMGRLWDMLDAARAVLEFMSDLRFDEFLSDRRTRNAVERNLEIIGEAARRVSQPTRDQYQNIPWRSIIGVRNVLAHEYGEIRYEILWCIIEDKLGPLIQQLEAMGVDKPPSLEEQ